MLVAQQRAGVDACYNKTGGGVGSQQHMKGLWPRRGIEHGLHWMDIGRLTVLQSKPDRRIHPRIREDHKHSRGCSGCGYQHASGKMRAGRNAVPTVEIDTEENRFGE